MEKQIPVGSIVLSQGKSGDSFVSLSLSEITVQKWWGLVPVFNERFLDLIFHSDKLRESQSCENTPGTEVVGMGSCRSVDQWKKVPFAAGSLRIHKSFFLNQV